MKITLVPFLPKYMIDPKGSRIHLTHLDFVTTRENLFQIQLNKYVFTICFTYKKMCYVAHDF